jgi:hypothetical protein
MSTAALVEVAARPAVSKKARLLWRLELAAIPSAVSWARRHTADAFTAWGYGAVVKTAELLATELVTNAVRHTIPEPGTETTLCPSCGRPYGPEYGELDRVQRITVTLVATDEALFIEVGDGDPRPPIVSERALLDEGGRGLRLVPQLAKAWSFYHPRDGGKVVWCELQLPAPGLPQRQRRIVQGRKPAPVMDDLPTLRRVRDGLAGLDDNDTKEHRG